MGGSCPSYFEAHPRRGHGGSTHAEASNGTADSTSGAWCSLDLPAPWEISAHTESRPVPVHVAQGCFASEVTICVPEISLAAFCS